MNARSLKSLFVIASTTAVLLAGCDSLPSRPTQADLPLRPSAVTDFAALYGENCAGCHGADAAGKPAMKSPSIKGKTVEEALSIKNTDIVRELALPPVKIHCSVLAEDAIKAAIGNWKNKKGIPVAASEKTSH